MNEVELTTSNGVGDGIDVELQGDSDHEAHLLITVHSLLTHNPFTPIIGVGFQHTHPITHGSFS